MQTNVAGKSRRKHLVNVIDSSLIGYNELLLLKNLGDVKILYEILK